MSSFQKNKVVIFLFLLGKFVVDWSLGGSSDSNIRYNANRVCFIAGRNNDNNGAVVNIYYCRKWVGRSLALKATVVVQCAQDNSNKNTGLYNMPPVRAEGRSVSGLGHAFHKTFF